MKKEFIKIIDLRIKINTIKKYKPLNGVKLNIYYSTSRTKVEVETFIFKSVRERNEMIEKLDIQFGII